MFVPGLIGDRKRAAASGQRGSLTGPQINAIRSFLPLSRYREAEFAAGGGVVRMGRTCRQVFRGKKPPGKQRARHYLLLRIHGGRNSDK